MFVRRATMEEADGLYALACGAARRELPRDVFDALLADALRRSSRRILTASENGEVVGYVDAELRPSLTQCAMVGVVCDLFVKEGCRGHTAQAAGLRVPDGRLLARQRAQPGIPGKARLCPRAVPFRSGAALNAQRRGGAIAPVRRGAVLSLEGKGGARC